MALAGGVLVVVLALVLAVTVIRRTVDSGPGARRPGPSAGATPTTAVLTDQTAAQGFVAGATSAIAAVTSYDYRDLPGALDAGLAVSTGAYRTAYRTSLQGSLGATARRDRLVQTFQTLRAGIGRSAADGATATVLLFGLETRTRDEDAGSTRTTPTTLAATMVRRGDRYLISGLEVGGNAGLPPGSAQLAVAAEAGRREVLALLTFRRADFATDQARALAGAVDPLRATVAADAASTRAAMDKGGFDRRGTVTAVAVDRASGSSVVLLVAATGSRVAPDGVVTVDNDARLAVTVVRAGDLWKVSDVEPVTS